MKLFLLIYAGFLFTGGFIGYYLAGSFASLAMGMITSLAFAILAYQKGKAAFYITFGLSLAMLLFFSYRFASTMKFMPAGLMGFLTMLLLIKLGWEFSSKVCCESDKDRCCIPSDHKKL